jgi:hypothetical protein
MAVIPDLKSIIAEIDSKIGHPNFYPTDEASFPKKNVPLEFEQRDLTVKDAVVVLDIDATLVGSFENWKFRYNKTPFEQAFEMVHDEERDDLFDLLGALYVPCFGCFDLLRMLWNRKIRFCFFSSGTKTRNYNLVRWLLSYAFGEEEGKKVWDSVSVFSREDMGVYTYSKDLNIVIGLDENYQDRYSRDPKILKARENAESKSKTILPWIVLADDRCSSSKSEQKESFLHVFDPQWYTKGSEILREVVNIDLRVVYIAGVIRESISLLSKSTPSSPKTFSAAVQKVIKRYSDRKIIKRGLCALKHGEKKEEKEKRKRKREEENDNVSAVK